MSESAERWAQGPTILESIWRFRWVVLGVALAAGLLGYFVSQTLPPAYEATTRLYVTNPATSGVFQQQPSLNLDRYLPQQAQRIRSAQVLAAAAEDLADGTTPTDLALNMTMEADLELGTLSITMTDDSAAGAAAAANAVAAAYQENVRVTQLQRVTRAVEELERSAEEIETQIDALLAGSEDLEDPASDVGAAQLAGQLSVLTQRLVEIETLGQQLQVDARLFGSGVDFVEQAEPPAIPASPRPRRTAIIGALLAGLVASAVAYWLAGRGHRVESRDEPAEILQAPLLGVLPTYRPPDQVTLVQRATLDPRTAEAYRFIYSSLDATLREQGASSVMITSAGPATGKTETALQLAATAARRGQQVLLVDADVRLHGLTSFLRAESARGLLDLPRAGDGRTPDALTMTYPLENDRQISVLTVGLGAGKDDHLDDRWFGASFGQLVKGYDLVVVDSPPLLAVADTATIAGQTDTMVLVTREGTDIEDLERVRDRLRLIRQRLAGYVYLSAKALEGSEFDYGLVRSEALGAKAAPSAAPPGGWSKTTGPPGVSRQTDDRDATSASTTTTKRREQRS
jgi:Mrp family chromosome partitioning ATPase